MAYEKLKQEQYRNLGGIEKHHSKYQTGDTKFLDLRNYSFERPGALISRPGTEYHLTLNSGSYVVKPFNLFQYTRRDGASQLVFDNGQTFSSYNGAFAGVFATLTPAVTTGLVADIQVTDNVLHYANGYFFGRYNGTAMDIFNLPIADSAPTGMTFNTALSGPTATIPSGTFSISYQFARGYEDIYQGPFYEPQFAVAKFGTAGLTPIITLGIGATIQSAGRWVFYGFTVPPNYGISGIIPFLNRQADGTTSALAATPAAVYLTLVGGTTLWHAEFNHLTASQDFDLTRNQFTLIPKNLAVYNNILMTAGFTSLPSHVFFSEPGEPDNIQPDNFFEVRTDNGDKIQGLAFFQDALVVFKKGSVHELSGGDASSFQLRTLSTEYGLLNQKGFVVWENRLWFIDQTGIIEYDGANFENVSEPIDPYLSEVDKSKIYAVHVKKERQVWFCAENKCFVYDYDVQGWTIYDNLPLDRDTGAAVISYGSTRSDLSFWRTGSSFFELVRFGDSLTADLGNAITLIAETRFHKRLENTTQELWRRLFVNHDVPGSTQGLTMQLIPDYGTSVYATRSVYLDSFQKRVEFGISARALSVKFIIQSSQSIRFNGYTIESRFLRKI